MFGTGLSALAIILISRTLGPTAFGEFSVGLAISVILSKINDLGLSIALQKLAKNEDHEQNNALFSETTKIKLVAGVVIAVIGIVLGQWLSDVLKLSSPWIIYGSFTLSLATVFFEHLQAVLQSLHRFMGTVVLMIAQSTLKLLFAVFFFWQQASTAPLVLISYLLAPALPLIAYTKLLPQWVKIKLQNNTAHVRPEVFRVAQHSLVTLLATTLIENSDILFVQQALSSYETGLLGGVSKIALFFNIIAFSLSSVLNPRVARYHNKHDLRNFILKGLLLLPVVALGFLAILPFTSLLIRFSVGSEYLAVASILILLNLAAFITIAAAPFVALFFSYDAPWFFSLSGIVQIIIILVGNLIFVPEFGLEAAAWTRVVARLSLLGLSLGLGLWLYSKKTVPSSG